MPSFDEHCAESITLIGKPFGDVHRWLDEFAGKPPYEMKHRRIRHHKAGIEEVRRLWETKRQPPAPSGPVRDLQACHASQKWWVQSMLQVYERSS